MFLRKWWEQRNLFDLVALDIDSESIKLLKINSTEIPFKVENFAVASLPPSAIIRNEIKDENLVSTTLKDLFRRTGVKTTAIALAIPRSSALIKRVSYDKRFNEAEIESRAWVEANRNFPDLVGNIYLDFSILGSVAQDANSNEMVLVACRKEQIDPYLELCKKSNITPRIVDINSYALQRSLALLQSEPEKIYALLNINMNSSTLIVSQGENLLYAHDDTYDGNRLKTQINTFLSKTENGPAEYSNPAYQNILRESLSSHLRHAMHFFYSSKPEVSIAQIFVSGDCALYAGLPEFIQQEIGMPANIARPFEKMQKGPDIDTEILTRYEPALMLCCGLALSSLK